MRHRLTVGYWDSSVTRVLLNDAGHAARAAGSIALVDKRRDAVCVSDSDRKLANAQKFDAGGGVLDTAGTRASPSATATYCLVMAYTRVFGGRRT